MNTSTKNIQAYSPIPLNSLDDNDDQLEEHLRNVKKQQYLEQRAKRMIEKEQELENLMRQKLINSSNGEKGVTYDYNGKLIIVKHSKIKYQNSLKSDDQVNPLVSFGKTIFLDKKGAPKNIDAPSFVIQNPSKNVTKKNFKNKGDLKFEDFIQDQAISDLVPSMGVKIVKENGGIVRGRSRSPETGYDIRNITKKEYETMIRVQGNYDFTNAALNRSPRSSHQTDFSGRFRKDKASTQVKIQEKPQKDQDLSENLKKKQMNLLTTDSSQLQSILQPPVQSNKNTNNSIKIASQVLKDRMLYD